MTKYFLLFVLFFGKMQSQSIQQIDSMTYEMCTTLKGLTVPDSLKMQALFDAHLPSIQKIATFESKKEANEMMERLYFRFQKNCEDFVLLISRLEGNFSEPSMLSKKPKPNISEKDCKALGQNKKYYYNELDGGIVHVEIANGIWRETFPDKTVSILNFVEDPDCEFTLEFIRSDNLIRKNLSVKGDKYHYGIFDKKGGVYSLWIQGSGEGLHTFFLYS